MFRRIAVVVALAAAGAVAAGLFLVLDAPTPEALCAHVMEVTLAEAEASPLSPATRKQLEERLTRACIRHKRDKLQLRGRIAYARYARCVMEASTLRDIEAC